MSSALALYRKELAHLFNSPIAYFVAAVFLVGTGYFFTYNIFLTGIATMNETFQNMGILVLVVLPLISMRLFSAEYTAGTMELLQTLPLAAWQIVLAKYLGAVTLLLLIMAGTLVDLVPLYVFSAPETSTILSGYLGFLLLGMTALAIGQMFSALTENQIVAALITISVLLGFWFIGHLQAFQNTPLLHAFVGHLSFSAHYGQFVDGLFRTEAAIYYLAVAGIALVTNAGYLEWRR